jgi:uncharacterized protein YeaO (DUF488 family)
MLNHMKIRIKRVYDAPSAADGQRILIDRLWPRGLSKERAKVDLWLKAIAPSTPLRQWFGHDPGKWPEFKKRYRDELNHNSEAVAQLRAHLAKGTVTFVYGAKDQEHNDAVVLQEYVEERA